jgi:adenylate cyclase
MSLDKYGLYKVEIIGDAYFCVSGCPDANPNHAANLANAALELIDSIPELQKLANTKFELRVGMHTGPVVGGVVGINNPRYHVFGDAVSLANSMESTGQVGRLHCSQAAYDKLKDNSGFEFETCPEEEISGFGKQVTYFVSRK